MSDAFQYFQKRFSGREGALLASFLDSFLRSFILLQNQTYLDLLVLHLEFPAG